MKTRDLVLTGLMIAVVYVITRYFQVPIPQTKGYFNLGEAGIYITAVLFGPGMGALAGGIGSALADVTTPGAAQYAIFTLVIKGIEGLLVGVIASGARRASAGPAGGKAVLRLVAMLVGGFEMVIGYFVAEAYFLKLGAPAALVEVPANMVQVAVGVVAGLAVAAALGRSMPDLSR